MKLKDLISVSKTEWLEGFKEELEERGAQKTTALFWQLAKGKAEKDVLKSVYSEVTDKTKRTFNSMVSSLYKEYLTYLVVYQRHYPEIMMADLKSALFYGDEDDFNNRVPIVERILTDTENLEQLSAFYILLKDHHYAKVTKPKLLDESRAKLRTVVAQLNDYHGLEDHFFDNDLGRLKKETKYTSEELQVFVEYYEQFYSEQHPVKTRIQARVLRIRLLFCFQMDRLNTDAASTVSNEVAALCKRYPYLYFTLPEMVAYSNISYQSYTGALVLPTEQFNDLFINYHNKFDGRWILATYPRIYQALLTCQISFNFQKAGIRFKDDQRTFDPSIKDAIERILSLIKRVRNRPSYSDENRKMYGILTEAYCWISLAGEHYPKAIEIFHFILKQEKQRVNAHGTHETYRYLCTAYFLNKDWDELLLTAEKYQRFINKNGQKDEASACTLQFQTTISQVMLNEVDYSAEELKQKCHEIYKGQDAEYERWVPYTLNHLNLG